PFWRAWLKLPRRDVHAAPRKVPTPANLTVGRIPPGNDLGGETRGRKRMLAFDHTTYARTRDRLDRETSFLSPYLHFRCLSPPAPARAGRRPPPARRPPPPARRPPLPPPRPPPPPQKPPPRLPATARQPRMGRQRRALRRLARGPHGLPGRRRRDAPAQGDR